MSGRRTAAALLVAAAACVWAPTAGAAPRPATLVFGADRVVRLGALKVSHPTTGAARAHFGDPSNVRELAGGTSCVMEWRAIGLALQFTDYNETDACGAT